VPVHYNGSTCPCITAVVSARYYIKSGKVPVHCIGATCPCTTEGKMPLTYSENECSCSTARVGARALHQLENKCQCTTAGISVHGRGNKRPCTTAGASAHALHQYRIVPVSVQCALQREWVLCATAEVDARDTTAGIRACALQQE
jgi:hypothetical protein